MVYFDSDLQEEAVEARCDGFPPGLDASLIYLDPIAIFRACSAEKIGLIRKGVPALLACDFIDSFSDAPEIYRALELKRTKLQRMASKSLVLSTSESERVIGLAELLGQIEVMVGESGSSTDFNARTWLSDWLLRSVPALGGMVPMEFLGFVTGQKLLSKLLMQMQTSAYA